MNEGEGEVSRGKFISEATSHSVTASVSVPSNEVPRVLKVLELDGARDYLHVLGDTFKEFQFQVTRCGRVENALHMLTRNRDEFDIILSNAIERGTDAFELLRKISVEMDLPVIMMSGDDNVTMIIRSIVHDFTNDMSRPIQEKLLCGISQHVQGRRKGVVQSPNSENDRRHKTYSSDASSVSELKVRSPRNLKRKKYKRRNTHEVKDRSSSVKKRRVVWDHVLHAKFIAALKKLGDKAVPKKILEIMNVPGLTRENVASHLQKYRLNCRKRVQESCVRTMDMSIPSELDLYDYTSHDNWKAATWYRDQSFMNRNEWYHPPLQGFWNMNPNLHMAPAYQSTQPGMARNPMEFIFSDGVAKTFPLDGNIGPIEMSSEDTYNPTLQAPSSLDMSIRSYTQNMTSPCLPPEEFSLVNDFSQMGYQDWELRNLAMEFNGSEPGNTVPLQSQENAIPNMGAILDNVTFAEDPESESFPPQL